MTEHAKAPRRVAEAARHFGRGESVDEVGTQGLVLAMGGVGWLKKKAGDVR